MKYKMLVAALTLTLGGTSLFAQAKSQTEPRKTTDQSSSGTARSCKATDVFFEFDSARVGAETRSQLARAACWAKKNPQGRIILHGHADPVGASDYNVGLSGRRAEAVRAELIALGVRTDHIVLALYGEDGPRRATHAEDRRVSVISTTEPLYSVVDQALQHDATALVWDEPVTLAELEGPAAETVAGR